MSDIDQLDSKHRVAETEEEIDSRAEGEAAEAGTAAGGGGASTARLWMGGSTLN